MRIRYLSYGLQKTGGYRHEKCLFESAVAYYSESGPVQEELVRKNRFFTSIFSHLQLMLWSYFKSNADLNIVPARMAVSALYRNRKNQNKVWVVMHNYDDNDGKSGNLKRYYTVLFRLLRETKHDRFKLIAVAPFWVDYFQSVQRLPNVGYFPNLFTVTTYTPYKTSHKNNWVHLGQYSSKNDKAIIRLAVQLNKAGYYCYFSTLDSKESKSITNMFDVLYFETFKEYLEHISRSCCTLALTHINEGWNRVAHESILCGTPVIGYEKGGLGDLLRESNSVIVQTIDEAYTCITESLWVLPQTSFEEKYDSSQSSYYMKQLCKV